MNPLGDIPMWGIVLLSLLAAALLVVLNLTWLLAARGMLDGQRGKESSAPVAPTAEQADPTQNPRH